MRTVFCTLLVFAVVTVRLQAQPTERDHVGVGQDSHAEHGDAHGDSALNAPEGQNTHLEGERVGSGEQAPPGEHAHADESAQADAHGQEETEGEQGEHEGEGAHADEVTLTSEVISSYGIIVAPVQRQFLTSVINAPAHASFNREAMAHVGSPVDGRVAELLVRQGDPVQEGDVLLVVDSPTLGEAQSRYLQARSGAEVAHAARDMARVAAERARMLTESGGLSQGELTRREGELRQAEGQLIAAESAVTAAENTLHIYGMSQEEVDELASNGEINPRYRVRAPISGRVIQREVTLGEVVGPDQEWLLILADMTVLWVLADVPEAQIAQVVVGAPAQLTVGVLGNQTFDGTVALIGFEIDPNNRAGQVRIELPSEGTGIQPGMFAEVEFSGVSSFSEAADAPIAVPVDAVQRYEGNNVVFVAVPGEPNTFAARQVTVGPSVGRRTPILSGLSEGEEVVVAGVFILKAELGKAGAEHHH
jgi:cobalt-zinc-cadmium efflux system membrane fusion protein